MGNQVQADGRRVFDDVYTFPQDSQDLADDIYRNDNVRVGPASQRPLLPTARRRPGLLWVEEDTGDIYRCDMELAWQLVIEPELRPATVSGGTVDVFGGVVPTAGASMVRVNGVFSPRFRIYQVNFWLAMSTDTGGLAVNLVADGTPHTASQYNSQRVVASGASLTTTTSTASGAWSGSGVTGAHLSGEWIIRNPASSGIKSFSADASRAPGLGFSQERGWLGSAESLTFDGFQFSASAGNFIGGFVKVQPVG